MLLTQSHHKNQDFRKQKSKSKSKMLKSRHSHSQKSSFKHIQSSFDKNHSSITYEMRTPNQLITEKYFTPAMKQYERSDANMISECLTRNFEDFERQTMKFYQFVAFFTTKEHLKSYQTGIKQNLKEKFKNLPIFKSFDNQLNSQILHFSGDNFHILKNRSMKLKSLRFHKSQIKSEKISSTKQKQKTKKIEGKIKSKLKNMDNLLKGVLDDKKKDKQMNFGNIKKVIKISSPRQTHILSKDSQDLNLLLKELNSILKTHGLENYSEISITQEQLPISSHIETPCYSGGSTCSNFLPQKSKIKKMKQKVKDNQFAEIIQSQMSHLSAIKSSQIVQNIDQYEFYGLSAIKQKKMKKNLLNSTKNNESTCANQQISDSKSRLTNKKTQRNLQNSQTFSQDTPKNFMFRPFHLAKQQGLQRKSKSKTLRKGLNQKSKSKSLSSTQKSLSKDQSSNRPSLKVGKLLTNTKQIKGLSQRLLFMQPLNEKQLRKNPLIKQFKSPANRNQSKSKSKGKIMINKK